MGNPRYTNGHRRRQLRARILATRDTCALCGGLVDKTLHYLNPRAPVIDEDLAVSRGGDPLDPGNCNLMHRDCNQRKGILTIAEFHLGTSGPNETVATSRSW